MVVVMMVRRIVPFLLCEPSVALNNKKEPVYVTRLSGKSSSIVARGISVLHFKEFLLMVC